MKRKDAIRTHYEPRIEPGREHYDVVDWADAAAQILRFQVLVRNVDLQGKSLLDVGCGLGDLKGFLDERGIAVRYTGVDIVEKMIAAARRHHPEAEFVCADLFEGEPLAGRRFDVVFSSGAFNLDLGNNRDFLTHAVGRMLELAEECAAFNLLHDRAESKHGHCVYFDPAEVLRRLAPLPCETELLDNYLPNDFTVICRKRARE